MATKINWKDRYTKIRIGDKVRINVDEINRMFNIIYKVDENIGDDDEKFILYSDDDVPWSMGEKFLNKHFLKVIK